MEDNLFITASNKQRLTQAEKDANDKLWYHEQADLLDRHSFSSSSLIAFDGASNFTRQKVNYDLFNNIINPAEFVYVCKPFGAEVGDLPAHFTNRDIVSGKIKVLLGMEMKMPFSWTVIATNEEATTRKEQEEFGRIKNYVVNEIMRPIKTNIAKQAMLQAKQQQAQQQQGQQGQPQQGQQQQPQTLTPEEQQQLQQQIADETQAQTPDEVRKYMTREHQDPAEVMSQQILQYLLLKERVADKFNKGFKHSCLGGTEVYHVGIYNGEPSLTTVNALYFDHDQSPDTDYIEDGEWAVCEYRMTPSEVMSKFTSELDDEQIDRIYEYNTNPTNIRTGDFTFSDRHNEAYTVKVLHCTWKSLQKIGFLIYLDDNKKEQLMLVDENYKLNKKQGDISIQWEWIPQAHECYKILNDIYVYARPVPGQNRDLDNLYSCKLPYYGASTDFLNSPVTSPMDRMKGYQYFYDVICYRIELLMASDKGKILAANIKKVPKSSGIDINKFMYFMEANKIAWLNPSEEGNRGGNTDITNIVKEIDLSLASDIEKYISFAEYIEKKCGSTIGVTPQMEAAIGPDEAVTNTRQNLIQASHIIQPYFELHNIVKGNVLQALVDTAKVAYSQTQPRKLSYVLDDMSKYMLTTDPGLLSDSTLGLFISNSSKAEDAKQAIMSLSQAAMQNQQVDLLDMIKVLRSDNINQAEEDLEVGMQKKQEQLQANDKAKLQQQKDAEMRQDTLTRETWKHEADMIVLKETERRKTEVEKAAETALGMAKNNDVNNNGVPDVLELAKFGVDKAESLFEQSTKQRELQQTDEHLQLEKQKLAQKTQNDKDKNEIDKKKLNKPKAS